MRISVTRSGGFTGITRRAEVDTSARDDAEDWHDLVRRADLTGRGEPAGRPDRFTYRIDVDGTTAHIGETDLDEPTRELVDRVLTTGT